MTTTDADRKSPRRASAVETIQVYETLKRHLLKAEGESWVYSGDWSDEKVAEAITPPLSEATVARIRTELFGPLRPPGQPSTVELESVKARLVSIELRLDVLENRRPAPVVNNSVDARPAG